MKKRNEMKLRVVVRKEDIEHGYRNSFDLCPVAHALRRVGVMFPNVQTDRIAVSKSGLVWGNTPAKVRKFVQDFDCGKKVKPMTFNLYVSLRGREDD